VVVELVGFGALAALAPGDGGQHKHHRGTCQASRSDMALYSASDAAQFAASRPVLSASCTVSGAAGDRPAITALLRSLPERLRRGPRRG
jgi:hypothetical protein